MKDLTIPLVTVIVPVYNREQIVAETLDSVFDQTYRPIELIVVDDGSTDRTTGVVDEWMSRHNDDLLCFRTHLLMQKNLRAPAARNHGIMRSTGHFIQFLDSDDILYPEAISSKVAAIKEGAFEYAYTRNHLLNSDGKIVGTCGSQWPREGGAIATYLFDTISPLMPRYFFDQAGLWDESLIATDEIELHGRLKAKFGEGAFINEFHHAARDHGGERVSKVQVNLDSSAYRVLQKLYALIEGTALDSPAERNAISRLGCSVTESYATTGQVALAMDSLAYARRVSTGRRRCVLNVMFFCRLFLTRRLFLDLFVRTRRFCSNMDS